MTRRTRTALLVAALALAGSAALAVWAGPYWLGQARAAWDRVTADDRRERLLADLGALELPAGYRAAPCGTTADDASDRCWWTDAPPRDTAADLGAALTAAGVEGVAVDSLDLEADAGPTFASGTAHGFDVTLMATRVVDEDATLAAGELVLREGSFVHLLAGLDGD